MITHNNETTSVQFGKQGIGSVGLIGHKDGLLTIQQLVNDAKIGNTFDVKKDISELPKVILKFTDPESIDALIRCLEFTKKKMTEPPYPAWCYAA